MNEILHVDRTVSHATLTLIKCICTEGVVTNYRLGAIALIHECSCSCSILLSLDTNKIFIIFARHELMPQNAQSHFNFDAYFVNCQSRIGSGYFWSIRPINFVDIDQVRFESRPNCIRYGILFVDSIILHFPNAKANGFRFKKV